MFKKVGIFVLLPSQQTHSKFAHGRHRVSLQSDERWKTRHGMNQTLPEHDFCQMQRLQSNGRLKIRTKLKDRIPISLSNSICETVIIFSIDSLETLSLTGAIFT